MNDIIITDILFSIIMKNIAIDIFLLEKEVTIIEFLMRDFCLIVNQFLRII